MIPPVIQIETQGTSWHTILRMISDEILQCLGQPGSGSSGAVGIMIYNSEQAAVFKSSSQWRMSSAAILMVDALEMPWLPPFSRHVFLTLINVINILMYAQLLFILLSPFKFISFPFLSFFHFSSWLSLSPWNRWWPTQGTKKQTSLGPLTSCSLEI